MDSWRSKIEARKTIDETLHALAARFTANPGNLPAAQDTP